MCEQTGNLFEKTQSTETGGKTDINKKLILNMRDLNHIMRSLYEGKASQKRVLIILSGLESITQRDLTMRLGVQPGSASEILSKLENAGLILRTMSETDRRTANISLTEKGAQVALEAAEQRSKRHEEMFSCLCEKEKEDLLTILEKVNADWANRYGATTEERRGGHHRCRHACNHESGNGLDHGDDHSHEHGYNHDHDHNHDRDHNHDHGHNHDFDSEGMSEGSHGHRKEHRHGDAHRGDAQNYAVQPIETEEADHGEVY